MVICGKGRADVNAMSYAYGVPSLSTLDLLYRLLHRDRNLMVQYYT